MATMKEEIREYIKKKKIVSIPEIQQEFNLMYKDTRNLFRDFEKDEYIKPIDGLQYEYSVKDPDIYIEILYDCVMKENLSINRIKREFNMNHQDATMAIDWICRNGVKEKNGKKVLINKEEFFKRFGDEFDYEDDNDEFVFEIKNYDDEFFYDIFKPDDDVEDPANQYVTLCKEKLTIIFKKRKSATKEEVCCIANRMARISDHLGEFMDSQVFEIIEDKLEDMDNETFKKIKEYILNEE